MSVESFINEMEGMTPSEVDKIPKKGKLVIHLVDPIHNGEDVLLFYLKDYAWVNDTIGFSIQDRKTMVTLMIPYGNIRGIEIDPEKTTKRIIC